MMQQKLVQAEMLAAGSCVKKSQFQLAASQYTVAFELNAARAQAAWKDAHDVQMGRQNAENQQVLNQVHHDAIAKIGKLREKLDATQGQARDMNESLRIEALNEIH